MEAFYGVVCFVCGHLGRRDGASARFAARPTASLRQGPDDRRGGEHGGLCGCCPQRRRGRGQGELHRAGSRGGASAGGAGLFAAGIDQRCAALLFVYGAGALRSGLSRHFEIIYAGTPDSRQPARDSEHKRGSGGPLQQDEYESIDPHAQNIGGEDSPYAAFVRPAGCAPRGALPHEPPPDGRIPFGRSFRALLCADEDEAERTDRLPAKPLPAAVSGKRNGPAMAG